MGKIPDSGGIRWKLLLLMLALALVPMAFIGVLSVMEMTQASKEVQEKIIGLSTTLNRSALTVSSDEADQVQLATAKAGRYNEFFLRVKAENELVANYATYNQENQSCPRPAGLWEAPISSNLTSPEKRDAAIRSLCLSARILEGIVESEPAASLGYIGTEDGILIIWPALNETFYRAAPFDYRERPLYAAAKEDGRTVWTKPYLDSKGTPAITSMTPIYRDGKFFGVSGMDVSLAAIYSDLYASGGRGYPFIADRSGLIIMSPHDKPSGPLGDLFAVENLSVVNNSEVRGLVRTMAQGKKGSSVIGFGETDGYVAFAPISSIGWSVGVAYPAEEMSLPARFIDAGIKEAAKSATQGLGDAARIMKESVVIIFILTGFITAAIGIFISRRVTGQVDALAAAADRIARGDFDVVVSSSGDIGNLGSALSKMASDLKNYVASLEGDAEERGCARKELEILEKVKHSLISEEMPQIEGYEIAALSMPSVISDFGLYDVLKVGDDRIALAMADISGGGISSAILAVMFKAIIRACKSMDLSKTIAELNSDINEYAQGAHLACFYAVLDPFSHAIEYINAGFNPPFIVDAGGMVDTLGGGGIALGMLDRIELRPERIPIQPGDVFILYSNGITEAANNREENFGTEQLITIVREKRLLLASEILNVIKVEVQAFSKDHLPQSDATIVILKRSGTFK